MFFDPTALWSVAVSQPLVRRPSAGGWGFGRGGEEGVFMIQHGGKQKDEERQRLSENLDENANIQKIKRNNNEDLVVC